MATFIIPRIVRGRLHFETADVLSTFAQAAVAWTAPEAHWLDAAEPVRSDLRDKPPRRRCDDCQLHLTPDVLHALGSCPRWGKPRHGVESHCPAFVAKGGVR